MLGQMIVNGVDGAKRRQRGFTLIELFVGVAIIAIILAVGIPSLRDWMTAQRVSSVASELATDLRYAKSEAISANMRAGVVFSNAGNGCYTVYRGAPNRGITCNCTSSPVCPPWMVELKTVILPSPGDVGLSTTDGHDESYETGSALSFDFDDMPVITINGGHVSRRLSVVRSAGLHQPKVCTPAGSKIPGFKPC